MAIERSGGWLGAALGALTQLASGCGTQFQPGEELATVQVTPGEPFRVGWTSDGSVQQLWLAYDVAFQGGMATIRQGGRWKVEGPFDLEDDGEPAGSWTLSFTDKLPPVAGEPYRREFDKRGVTSNGAGFQSGWIHLVTLPDSEEGATLTLEGTFEAGSATEVRSLRLAVTR